MSVTWETTTIFEGGCSVTGFWRMTNAQEWHCCTMSSRGKPPRGLASPSALSAALTPPTAEETRSAYLVFQGRCGHCGNTAGGMYCLRTACMCYHMKFVGSKYMEAEMTHWNQATLRYEANPVSPGYGPDSPYFDPNSPRNGPDSPCFDPNSPSAASPRNGPDSPCFDPNSPSAASPRNGPNSPCFDPDSPCYDRSQD
jgi:hypothetical protein